MALSAADQAAVAAAAKQGGLSAAQGQNVINQANSVTDKSQVFIPANTNANPTSQNQVIGTSAPAALNAGSTGDTWESYNGRFYKNGDYTTDYGSGQLPSDLAHIIGTTSDNSAGGKIKVLSALPQATSQNPAQATQTNPASPQAQQTQATQQGQTAQQSANPLVMPANGSVVDLLNAAGADSSFAARSALAAQYGIQGYSGTAAQNTQLAQKYLDAHNALSGSAAVPQTSAAARGAIQAYQDGTQTAASQDPTAQFMDAYGSMNPIEASLFQQLSGLLSSTNTKTSLVDTYNQIAQKEGIPDLQLQLANINTIMSGTEDDIRDEITNSGGFATESQVQALATARNKTLLKQASFLQNQLEVANDYVDRVVSLTQADRAQATQDLQQKLGIAQSLVTMSENMDNAARQNYQNIVQSVGWGGLAASLAGNPQQTANAERLLGVSSGGLQALAYVQQQQQAANTKYQFVPGTDNQSSGVFDPSTGQFVAYNGGDGGDPVSAASAAILGNESNGSYTTISAVIPSGSAKGQQSYGKYQVLASNIPSWTKEYYGQSLTPQEFLQNPQAQEAVQKGKIADLWNQYGNIQDVASVYFTGVPYAKAVSEGRKDQATGMTVQQYVAKAQTAFNNAIGSSNSNAKTEVQDVNGQKVLINSKTGQIITNISQNLGAGTQSPLQLAYQQQSIQDASSLLTAPGLAGAVGPNILARSAPDFNFFTGVRSQFIAGVEQLTQQMTLDQLVNAKSNGATFGALSEGELKLLANSASKINSWAIKDSGGNVKGYNVSEDAFKGELNKIVNFQKLDFVLKGGDPSTVGVKQMPDGSYWGQNADGTYTKIQ